MLTKQLSKAPAVLLEYFCVCEGFVVYVGVFGNMCTVL